MAILGNIIKKALDLNAQLSSLPEDAKAAQKKQLRDLLEKAQDTSFGIYYGFKSILSTDDLLASYQKVVPLHDYRAISRRWWKQQQDHPNITWPGQPKYFALSSGTTGKRSKRIPVTDDMLACFRSVGQSQIAALANFDLPADLFEKDVLMLSSSADLTPHKEHLEGEISGINSSNIPGWFDSFYKPGKEIAAIDDWDERVQAIAEAAPDWDVVALAGIPSWVRMMLLKVIEHHQLETIHDLWPNLRLYASGGVAFAPHRRSFAALTKEPLQVLDTYLASEGFFAFTAHPGTMNMRLAIEHGMFFEFIPFDDRGFDETGQLLDDPLVLTIDEVEEGTDYALVVSTPAGAWRYLIGDTIKFEDLAKFEIRISGRTKYFLNVVGSQLSEEKLNAAVDHLADELGADISEYAVGAIQNDEGEYEHHWVLGGEHIDEERAGQILDAFLQDANKNYRVAREKALKGVNVTIAPRRKLYDWLEQKKKKGGQIKLPKVMKTKMLKSLLDYLA